MISFDSNPFLDSRKTSDSGSNINDEIKSDTIDQ